MQLVFLIIQFPEQFNLKNRSLVRTLQLPYFALFKLWFKFQTEAQERRSSYEYLVPKEESLLSPGLAYVPESSMACYNNFEIGC